MQIMRMGLILLIALMSARVYGKPTEVELGKLPAFCKARLYPDPDRADYKMWEQNLGPDFSHTHHYCSGLNFLNRYYRATSPQDKSFNLTNALNNFNYMVSHAKPTYSLMPDIYLNRGVTYSLMNQGSQAINDLNKALELNPRLDRAYTVLADYYAGIKEKDRALKIVITGLQYNPDVKGLQRRYRDLGGKPPYPEPILTDTVAPIQPVKPAVAEQSHKEETDASESALSPVGTPVEPIAQPKIGSPTNPYCRFCPD